MTRTLSALMSLVLGAAFFVTAGCEDEASKASLKTCNSSLESLQKSSSAQTASVNQLKADLAQAQAKVQELTKENEQLKSPRDGQGRDSRRQEVCISSQESERVATRAEPD